VQAWLNEFGPAAIVLALDVNIAADGTAYVATHGWQQTSTLTLNQLLDSFSADGLRHVLCTDISRDGMLSGSNIALYAGLKQRYPQLLVQASGGIASLDDLRQLQAINCDAAILGKALLTGQFTLEEALACWPAA
jgi:phosphoribosylformimino-5-aminoimidazole carboxamide ribotide isomerase